MPTHEIDEQAAQELSLYIDNDRPLYDQSQAIAKNLLMKMRRGAYDPSKAPAAFAYLIEAGAKKYAKEFSSPKEWNRIFSVPTRRKLAVDYARHFEREAKRGELDYLLKK